MKRKPKLTELRFDKLADELKRQVSQQTAVSGLRALTVQKLLNEVLRPTLLSYQLDWVLDDSSVKACEKSRRVGLSWAEAADDTLHAASQDGSDVWYIGYNKDMAEEFIRDCAWWAEQYTGVASECEEILIKDDDKDILAYRIRFASGYRITALSSRPSNLRGKQGRVVIDEAAFHDDFAGLLKAALALVIWGGSVRIISTHDGDTNPFNELIKDLRAGRKNYSLHRITFDEAVQQGLCKRVFEMTDQEWSPEAEKEWVAQIREDYGEDAAEELDVIPSQGSGIPFSRALVERCMSRDLPVLRYQQTPNFLFESEEKKRAVVQEWLEDNVEPLLKQMDPKRQSYVGEDFARDGDLTIWFPLQETADVLIKCPFILEVSNLPFEEQWQITEYIIDRLPRFTHGTFDARGNGQWLAEKTMLKYGEERITMSMASEKWYRENMPAYQAAYEDQAILIPWDIEVIDDHRAFRRINGVTNLPNVRRKSKTKGVKRHGDTGIAGCNAWHATRQRGRDDFEVTEAGDDRITSDTGSFLRR